MQKGKCCVTQQEITRSGFSKKTNNPKREKREDVW